MKDLYNYWLTRIDMKREIIKKVRQTFIPPIYKPAKPKKP